MSVGSIDEFELLLYITFFVIVVGGVFALIHYIMRSIAVKKILTLQGHPCPNKAWIPFYQLYIWTFVLPTDPSNAIQVAGPMWLPAGLVRFHFLVLYGIGCVPYIGAVLMYIGTICMNFQLFRYSFALIERRDARDYTLLAIVSAFIPIVGFIAIFTKKPEL